MPVREWKEVQEMLRSIAILAAVLAAVPGRAAIWPGQAGEYRKISSKPAEVPNAAVWKEYGLEDSEQAAFASGARRVLAAAYRFKDTTGAFAAFQQVRAGDPAAVLEGNYIVGGVADKAALDALVKALPNVSHTAYPNLLGFLPEKGLETNSTRYVLGPVSLAAFEPRVPAATAAFDFSTEAVVARYALPAGKVTLALFSYPSPPIALKQYPEFVKLPGAVAARKGPLVAVVFSPPDPDQAERLLASVRYNGQVSWDQPPPNPRDNVGDLLLNIFILVGILILLFLGAGIIVGIMRRWAGWGEKSEEMIVLNLHK